MLQLRSGVVVFGSEDPGLHVESREFDALVFELSCSLCAWWVVFLCWACKNLQLRLKYEGVKFWCFLKRPLLLFLCRLGPSPETQRTFIPEGFTDGLKPSKQLSASGDRRWLASYVTSREQWTWSCWLLLIISVRGRWRDFLDPRLSLAQTFEFSVH